MNCENEMNNASISILIGKVYRSVYKASRLALKGHGLSPAQYILLAALWEKEGQSGADLSNQLGLDSASMTGLLDRAEAKGLIARRPHDRDRRINLIWLSEQGKALKDDVQITMLSFDKSLEQSLNGETDRFIKNLKTLSELGH